MDASPRASGATLTAFTKPAKSSKVPAAIPLQRQRSMADEHDNLLGRQFEDVVRDNQT
jgi:hypothetical protein